MTFHNAIRNKDFTEALAMVQRGEDLLKSDFMFKLSDSFGPLLQAEAYDVLNAMIETEQFPMDTFDYDSFDNTIFKAIVEKLPTSSEAEAFLAEFISKVEGVNDSVQGKSFLSLAVEALMAPELMQVMIDNGCDPSYLNNGDETYLHRLANNSPSVVNQDTLVALARLFIDQGVDVDAKDVSGNTALLVATTKNLSQLAELLLDSGADVNEKNTKGDSALSVAQRSAGYGDSSMLNVVSQYGSMDDDDKVELCYQTIREIENGEPLREPSEEELEALDQFAGVDIYVPVKDPWGHETSIANEMVKKGSCWFKKFVELFDIEPNYTDDAGDTLLHKVAAVDVNFEEQKAKALVAIAKMLIKLGADPTIRNNSDKNAVDLASDSNYKEKLVVLLLRASK